MDKKSAMGNSTQCNRSNNIQEDLNTSLSLRNDIEGRAFDCHLNIGQYDEHQDQHKLD